MSPQQPAARGIVPRLDFTQLDRQARRAGPKVEPGDLRGEARDVALEILDHGIPYLAEMLRCSPETAVARFAAFAAWHLGRQRRASRSP